MSIQRLRRLVVQAERRANSRAVDQVFQDDDDIHIDGIVYGRAVYLAPYIREFLPLARALHEADLAGDTEEFLRLAKNLEAIKKTARDSFRPRATRRERFGDDR